MSAHLFSEGDPVVWNEQAFQQYGRRFDPDLLAAGARVLKVKSLSEKDARQAGHSQQVTVIYAGGKDTFSGAWFLKAAL
jgi:hypothetical protein